MGPKTSRNTGADFQKKVDRMFDLENRPEEEPQEKEEKDAGDKKFEDE